MILIECSQGTEEWKQARLGVITASKFKDGCEKKKDGQYSEKAKLYAAELAIERATGVLTEDQFQTWQMRRGVELEPDARMAYEIKTGNLSSESGVVITDDKRFGYSTDGFIDNDGCNEIKCVASALKVIEMLRNEDLSEYIHQIQGGLWITGRQWCDFVMYCPQLVNVGKEIFIKRVFRNETFIELLEKDLMKFDSLVCENVELLTK